MKPEISAEEMKSLLSCFECIVMHIAKAQKTGKPGQVRIEYGPDNVVIVDIRREYK